MKLSKSEKKAIFYALLEKYPEHERTVQQIHKLNFRKKDEKLRQVFAQEKKSYELIKKFADEIGMKIPDRIKRPEEKYLERKNKLMRISNDQVCIITKQLKRRTFTYTVLREPHIKSRAAYLLLKERLKAEEGIDSDVEKYLTFRHQYLRKQRKATNGILVCEYCGRVDLIIGTRHNHRLNNILPNLATIDHITPLSKGGNKFDEENCVVSCKKCNKKKGSSTETPKYDENGEPYWENSQVEPKHSSNANKELDEFKLYKVKFTYQKDKTISEKTIELEARSKNKMRRKAPKWWKKNEGKPLLFFDVELI